MRRGQYKCIPDFEHAYPCRKLAYDDECACGCDIVGTCQEYAAAGWVPGKPWGPGHPGKPRNWKRRSRAKRHSG